MIKFVFWVQTNIEVFYKVILSFWVSVTRHAQSAQNKFHIFAISPLKHGDEVDFLPVDKHKSFLQDDSITCDVRSQACPKYPKQQVYNIFAINMLRKM